MSNSVLTAVRPLQMPPTAKAVLVCLADYANDDGRCWPSIDAIAVFTCFGRTAVITAIRWLESTSAICADRTNGRHTAYRITPERFHPSACHTGPAAEPVRLPHPTSTAGVLDPSVSRTAPVREADSNHHKPSGTPKKATTKGSADDIALPDWLPARAWADWCDHRRAIKSPMTLRAAELSIEKLAGFLASGLTPESVINNAIERGWRGLYAPNHHGPPATGKPSAAADFRGKTYDRTALDDLPPDLRAAALAELGNG